MLYINIILYFLAALIAILFGLYIGLSIMSHKIGKDEDRRYGYSRKKSREIEKRKKKEALKAKRQKQEAEDVDASRAAIEAGLKKSNGTDADDPEDAMEMPGELDLDDLDGEQNFLSGRLQGNKNSYAEFVCNSMGTDPVTAIRKKRRSQDKKYTEKAQKKASKEKEEEKDKEGEEKAEA